MACHCNIFCERCGDCLECYWEDPCSDGGEHQYPSPDELAALIEQNKLNDENASPLDWTNREEQG